MSDYHLELARELGGINQSLKDMCREMKEVKEHLATQNGRINKSEDEIMNIKTKATLIAGVTGTVVYFLWDFIKIKLL